MIDPRLDLRPQVAKDRERTLNAGIQEKFAAYKQEAYIPGLISWWKDLRRRPAPRLGELPRALRPRRFIRKDDELIRALDRVTTSRTPAENEVLDGVALKMIGRAIAKTLARPNLAAFDKAADFFNLNHRSWDEFVAQLKETNPEGWAKALATTNPKLADYLGFGKSGLPELQAAQEQVKDGRQLDLYSLWKGISRCHLMSPLRMRLWALKLIAPGETAKVLDRFEVPGAIKEACDELGLGRNREELLALISSAPPVYNAKRKTTGHALGVFLPELVLDYADNLKRSIESLARLATVGMQQQPANQLTLLCEKELPAWFDEAFGAILAREDGSLLLKHFAVHLMILLSNNTRLDDPLDIHWIAIESLRRISTAKSSSWAHREFFERKTDFPQMSRRVSDYYPFLAYCVFDESAVREQWEWYRDLLNKQDSDLIRHLNPYGKRPDWHFQLIGRLIASDQNPLTIVEAAWNSLYSQRFEARFQIGGDTSRPSVHLLESARGALGWLVSKEPVGSGLQSAQRLWDFLFIHEVEMHLGLARAANTSLTRELAMLFAYAPMVFKTEIKLVFQKASALLDEDPLLTASIAAILLQNRFAKPELERLLQPQGGLAELRERALQLSRLGLGDYPPVFGDAALTSILQ